MEASSTALGPISSASGEKAKARDIIAAIRTLKQIEQERRAATLLERQVLARYGGFGAVALSLFPHAITGTYKDAGWQRLSDELQALLTPEEYASARATITNAYYTSPSVMRAMHAALKRMGVADNALVLEPGCGIGNFMSAAPAAMRFIGVEKDGLTGRIARLLHPQADIRIQPFQDTRLPTIDAVIGNPPFGDIDLKYGTRKLPIHDFFIAKSLDALKSGGILAVVTSHYTLDKLNAANREYLAERADFVGAIRLPSSAFRREGTPVVTDILCLRKRADGEPSRHADPDWLVTGALTIDGVEVAVNRYFLKHPEQVLGDWSRDNLMYGGQDGYSVKANGDLAAQLDDAIQRLPELAPTAPAAKPDAAPAFTPPPPEKHITEGSLFVGDNKVIHQVQDGQGIPVTHRGKPLKADGTMLGKRLAALIGMVTLTRHVLQSQNEGWPEAYRQAARRDLNRARDLFVAAYGPINKTTFSETADGTVIRRMPNLVRFREDPDAMLVMALEEYDEVTGRAAKAPILLKDVVGKRKPIDTVASAEEGLLVSLDRTGGIDLALIATLYGKPEEAIIDELGDLIYHDPIARQWQTADIYLSGNVRDKLKQAEAAGPAYSANAEALRQVLPEDVLPGDIDAGLGAPWIPVADIQAFAAQLFGVGLSDIQIGHLKRDAVWTIDASHAAEASVAATADYGMLDANGTWLLDLALNMKSPVIHDTIEGPNGKETVVNQEKTLAAREKQTRIKQAFKSWLFAEPDRADRLHRLYNDTYNNLRLRQFDGSHLEFPGMSQGITLDPHQQNATWRGMTSGNTLIGHVVGGGKSFTMAATGMKMKQAGLIQKPAFVEPNPLLEQFAREFMRLYPNAKLLVATKEDLTRERRKLLVAKIATGHWDGVIMTHSTFERIGMSKEYQEKFLRQQIDEYDQLLRDHASKDTPRNIIKAIEKQKLRHQERLKELLAEEKKDDGLVFDELGIDHVFIDEAHYFKNLETPTKMERVAGIQTGGSERAFDLFMKARYLGEKHPGHGVTFATGTPVSNTMVELYTMQRFLDPEGLLARGIEHFDAWAATFGEIVELTEIAPDGASLRTRSRFAKFKNLPELQQMVRSFADIQTDDMLNLKKPKLEGGKPNIVACPMSEHQAALQQWLVARYDRVRREKVDPREDNALAITTDGRKLALDARLLSPDAEDFPGSKINVLVDRVAATWRRTTDRRGTQMIFCDMGVNPTPWGFCVYDEIIAKLVARGIPRQEIAAIGDADSDAKKQALLERFRQGTLRVLIGSTQKLGVGTNGQRRLVRKHDLDPPWRPDEILQRDGRILRPGNENEVVGIDRYVTEGSFDAYMWQALETKARFINQIISGDNVARHAEDIGSQELSYAEVKAIASGNPAVLTLADADAELHRLSILRKNHEGEQFLARRTLKTLPDTIRTLTTRLAHLKRDQATLSAHAHDPITIGDRTCQQGEAMERLGRRLDTLPERVRETTRIPLGRYHGLAFGISLYGNAAAETYLEGATTRHTMLSREHRGPRAVLNALDRLAGSYASQCDSTATDLAIAEGQKRDYEARLGQAFPHETYLTDLTGLRDQLRAGLSQAAPEPGTEQLPVSELAERIKSLKAANTIDTSIERAAPRRLLAAEPVTTRIRRRHALLAAEEQGGEPPAPPAEITCDDSASQATVPQPVPETVIPAVIETASPPPRPLLAYHQQISHGRRQHDDQLCLF